MSALFCQPATIYRPTRTGTDSHGQPITTLTDCGTTYCRVSGSGLSAREAGTRSDAQVTDKTIYFLSVSDVLHGDQIEVGGVRYEIDGIESVFDGAGNVHHKKASVRTVN